MEQYPNTGDRRRVSRVDFNAQVIIAQQGATYPAQLLDISVKGVLIRSELAKSIKEGEAALIMQLTDSSQIIMAISLIHRHDDELGFRCDSIDVESAAHLRRLIELNLNIPNAAERVLQEMLAAPVTQD